MEWKGSGGRGGVSCEELLVTKDTNVAEDIKVTWIMQFSLQGEI